MENPDRNYTIIPHHHSDDNAVYIYCVTKINGKLGIAQCTTSVQAFESDSALYAKIIMQDLKYGLNRLKEKG